MEKFAVPVYAPAHERSPISCVTHPLEDGDRFHLDEPDLSFEVIGIPGHTLGHIAYHGEGSVFCGDTLFSAGCGKVFEGTADQMYASLQKLAALPEDTRVYCGHEYTAKNLAFAQAVEPGNEAVREQLREARDRQQHGTPTLPSNIGKELLINPFLRCEKPSVAQAASAHAGQPLQDPVHVFGAVRAWKDNFQPPKAAH